MAYKSILLMAMAESGLMRLEIPKIHKMLKIFEPITFPTAISYSFFNVATTDEANSGMLVPTEIIVKPITVSLTPSSRATKTAPLISNSEPATKMQTPSTTIPTDQYQRVFAIVGVFSGLKFLLVFFARRAKNKLSSV